MVTRVTGPILLPNTPDCDYANGEQPLTDTKIDILLTTFKDYNIIDYNHEFTDNQSTYYLSTVGDLIRVFKTDKEVTFTDLSDNTITVPEGTAWATVDITNPEVEQEINDKEIVAFSVSVAEQADAETIISTYNASIKNVSIKKVVDLQEIHERVSNKRTNISDFTTPHMFSISVVKFPCVYKAMFCKDSVQQVTKSEPEKKIIMEADKMSEEQYNEDNWYNDLKRITDKLTRKNEENTGSDTVNKKEVQEMINEANKKLAEELDGKRAEDTKTILEALKELTTTTDEEEEITGEGVVEEEINDITSDDEEEIVTEDENEEEETTGATAGKGDKSMKKPSVKSTQPKQQHHTLSNKKQPVSKYNERKLIDNVLNNKQGYSVKGLHEIDNYILDSSIKRTFDNETFLALQTPLMREVYKASYASINEEQTRRAILPTNVFATFVQKIIQSEPFLDYVTTVTGLDGKAEYVTLDGSKIETQDGIAPEHYYYDRDPELSEVDELVAEFETFPQAVKLNLSDRQRLSNRFGEDLVNAVLEIGQKRFQRGVAAARIYSSTSHATSKDIQFRREDGYIAQAGVQLTNTTDFDIDDILATIDTMFYALPSEARNESNYALFVPSGVERAYRNYFIRNAGDRRIDFVTNPTQLYYGKIPIIESPTLSDESLMNEYNDGNASMILTAKENTLLGVGREMGIEPERVASNASYNYYLRGDTGAKYVIPEYTVCATIDGDDYKTIPVNTQP